MADESDISSWTDRRECTDAVPARRGGLWRVASDDLEPSGASTFLEHGHHESGGREQAGRGLLDRVWVTSSEPDEAARFGQRLREAPAAVTALSRAERG